MIKHYALRRTLWRTGYTPFQFIKFLDHCASLILLKKVGGVGGTESNFGACPESCDLSSTQVISDDIVGQLRKFIGNLPNYLGFNGECLNNPAVPCDLFLLSWTLTPLTAVWPFSRLANKELVDKMAATGSNGFGKSINLLYCDYAEYSRSTDVAVIRNGCAGELPT